MQQVPLDRMKFPYLMKRTLYLAISIVQSKTLKRKMSIKEPIQTAIRSFCGNLWYVIRKRVVKGRTGVDYVVACPGFAFVRSVVAEGVSKVEWRN